MKIRTRFEVLEPTAASADVLSETYDYESEDEALSALLQCSWAFCQSGMAHTPEADAEAREAAKKAAAPDAEVEEPLGSRLWWPPL